MGAVRDGGGVVAVSPNQVEVLVGPLKAPRPQVMVCDWPPLLTPRSGNQRRAAPSDGEHLDLTPLTQAFVIKVRRPEQL